VLHAAMDENNDAMVSLDEASAFVKGLRTSLELQNSLQIMETIDANKDGSLSQQEYVEDLRHLKITHERRQHFGGKFMAFDDNGDAVLSHEEALPLFNFMFTFQNLDSNKDDLLTMREFKQIAAAKLQGAPPEEVAKSNEEAKTIFAGLDTNGDKRIDAKEHYAYASGTYAALSALQGLFGLADTNEDRLLSAEELVECRSLPQFGGSAAYHHAQDWIDRIEAALEQVRAKSEL